MLNEIGSSVKKATREELIDKKVVRHKNLRSNKSGLMVAHSKIWGADYDTAIIQTPDPNYKQFCWPDEIPTWVDATLRIEELCSWRKRTSKSWPTPKQDRKLMQVWLRTFIKKDIGTNLPL